MYFSPFDQKPLFVALNYFERGHKIAIGKAIAPVTGSYFILKFNDSLMTLMPNMNVRRRMIARVDHKT